MYHFLINRTTSSISIFDLDHSVCKGFGQKKISNGMGRHSSSFFSLYADPPTFFICCFLLFLVMIQNSPMPINMFFRICDAMCKVVRKNTFFGLCHVVVVIGNLSHMGWHKMHFMLWTSCIWTCVARSCNTKNAQAREMQLWGLQNVMFICSSTNITPHVSC
jgi:hypothetical protein